MGGKNQKQTGMGVENLTRSNPLFLYCKPFMSNGGTIDAFSLRAGDMMHDLFLGLVKEVSGALADVVLRDNSAIDQFQAACTELHLSHVRGFTATVMRAKDSKVNCQTTLLHSLQKRSSLFAREYQELLPVLPLLFHAAMVDGIDGALPSFCDLVVFSTFLQSREWPLDAPTEWWEERRNFGITAYTRLQTALVSVDKQLLSKERRFLKIHNMLTHHVTESLRRHGSWCGTQGLEGLFGAFKKLSTNRKLMGGQLLRKMNRNFGAGVYFASSSDEAKLLENIISGTADRDPQTPGNVSFNKIDEHARRAAEIFCREHNIDFSQGQFIKWLRYASERDAGGAERGVRKIYACGEWHGRPKFDTLEIVRDGRPSEYCQLAALFRTSTGTTVAIGTPLQVCVGLPYHYRMPVLRFVKERPLIAFQIDDEQVFVCQMLPHLRPLDEGFRLALHTHDWPAYKSSDSIFHHNILCTYGEMRYWDERRWLTEQ